MPQRRGPRALEVVGGRDLERERVAVDHGDVVAGCGDEGRVIGVLLVGRPICGIQDAPTEPLRSLSGGELGTIDRRDDRGRSRPS